MDSVPETWIGVDFDGTLAFHEEGSGVDVLGAPVPLMLSRVRGWLAEGKVVKILTARASDPTQVKLIRLWCLRHLGKALEVTDRKDPLMEELWDDKAVSVIKNTGIRSDGGKAASDDLPSTVQYLDRYRQNLPEKDEEEGFPLTPSTLDQPEVDRQKTR